MIDYQNTAQGIATLGRGGDSTLVHMQPEEVEGLQQLALANGTSLTVNPNTGMPEAFNLKGLIVCTNVRFLFNNCNKVIL